jgi:homocysteine S-methyltransferase
MANAIRGMSPAPRKIVKVPAAPRKKKKMVPATPHAPHFLDPGGKKPLIFCEIDPPKGIRTRKTLEGMQSLVAAGADSITIGDSPLAILRMANVPMAYRLRELTGIDPIIHLSCRDRNLLAMQSVLMGAHLLGIRTILAITGDPARVGNQPSATSVFDLNSFSLLSLIQRMNEGENLPGASIGMKTDFIAGAAFNPNVRRVDVQMRRLEKKAELGARFAMTQPVFDLEKARETYETTGHIGIPIFLGLFPLPSWKNAEFLHNEVPGIQVPGDVRKRMRAAGEHGLEEGLKICREIIDETFDSVPGFYIIAPFNKAAITRTLVEHIRSRSPSRRR